MIVLDSSAWIEIFRDGPNCTVFRDAVAGSDGVLLPTISVFEIVKRMLRETDDAVVADIAGTLQQLTTSVALDGDLAQRAAGTALTTGLGMADAIILATARRHFAELWTQDADFEGLAGVRYVARKD